MTLAEFAAARLAEDEAWARDAMSGRWEVRGRSVYVADGPPSLNPVASGAWDYAPHIARHDPARVLREVAAKRKILARHAPHRTASGGLACDWCSEDTDDRPQLAKVSWPCGDVRDIAAIWSDHPDYDPSWERE